MPELNKPAVPIYLPGSPQPTKPSPGVGPKVSDFPLYSQTQNPPPPPSKAAPVNPNLRATTTPPVLPAVPTPTPPTPVVASQPPVPPPPGRNPAVPGSSILPPYPPLPGAPSPFATVNNPSKWN